MININLAFHSILNFFIKACVLYFKKPIIILILDDYNPSVINTEAK